MEKAQLVNFIAKVMEESGFKVYKNFKTPTAVVDIYAVMSTVMGEFSTIVSCKNYEKQWEVGIDTLKEMEMIGRSLKASKVTVVTTSKFSSQSRNYAVKKNIKLVDRENLITLAKKFSKRGASLSTGSGPIESGGNNIYSEDNGVNYNNKNNNDNGADFDNSIANSSGIGGTSGGFSSSGGNSSSFNVSQEPYPNYNFNKDSKTSYAKYDDGYNHYDGFDGDNDSSKNGILSSKLGSNSLNNKNNKNNVNNNSSQLGTRGHILDKTTSKKEKIPKGPIIKKILSNTMVIILIVVLISYLISLILGYGVGIGKGVRGIVQMATAVLLSYFLVFITGEEGSNILFKGTIVFFVSLVALILLVLML